MRSPLMVICCCICFLATPSCDSGDGSQGDEATCAPEEKKCDGEDVLKCNSSGTEWAFHKECESGCDDGICAATTCEPDCAGKQCGDDGCGGLCGSCGAAEQCVAGQCQCTPDCLENNCGDDGCGGICGSCFGPEGAVDNSLCVEGKCLACKPDCANTDCGGDGCGGSCGNCGDGLKCEDGKCSSVSTECECDVFGDVCETDEDYSASDPAGFIDQCSCDPDCEYHDVCEEDWMCDPWCPPALDPDCVGGCDSCEDFEECKDGECTIVLSSLWDVAVYSASISTDKIWDTAASPPDPYVQVWVGDEDGVTKSIADTYEPVWNQVVIQGVSAAHILTEVQYRVSDEDYGFDDSIAPLDADFVCTFTPTEQTLKDGFYTSSGCATSLSAITFKFAPKGTW
jgi:hypothetical protein